MRGRLIVTASVLLLLAACGGGNSDDSTTAPNAMPARTVAAGEVEVKIEPTRIDDNGAAFRLTLDTHSIELSTDLAREARLVVGTAMWTEATWSGDGTRGHHREGELRFTANGPATGTARLTLGGFPKPVDVSWDLEGTR